ncbi:2Fe-2S iron-sulfur cluster-binding protein [Undibacterium sp. RuRC25W]|uniref:2Fe-2S iron-sulfur cluster-binding protein n=1 Tax=Undibacterium sp. RuRC25W TaxID=3413047 RepID=UPI003BF3A596
MMEQNKQSNKTIQIYLNGQWVTANGAMTVAALILSQTTYNTRTSVTGMQRFAVCGMGACQECRVSVNGRPHQLACQVWCETGMVIETGGAK